jgi:hypothetical protein
VSKYIWNWKEEIRKYPTRLIECGDKEVWHDKTLVLTALLQLLDMETNVYHDGGMMREFLTRAFKRLDKFDIHWPELETIKKYRIKDN